MSEGQYKGLSAEKILEVLNEGQMLDTKKAILKYIDRVRESIKEDKLDEKQILESYTLIEHHIMSMNQVVKPNTIVYLKNELRLKLGKFVHNQSTSENEFVSFFKKTYENEVKTKAYTWVLSDLTKIKDQQILDTLKTINVYCFKQKLTVDQKKDIYPMIERIIDGQNIRYINQIRSMEGIRKAFQIKIVQVGQLYKISKLTK